MSDARRQKIEHSNLIEALEPELLPGRYVFVSPGAKQLQGTQVLASVREPEGLSLVLKQDDADAFGFEYGFVAAWITLRVKSALDSVGLTAVVSASLAEAGISCNVIAGLHHDHLLVPVDRADRALKVLVELQDRSIQAIPPRHP